MQENNTIPTSKKRPSGAEGRRRNNERRVAAGLPALTRKQTAVEAVNNRIRMREVDRKKRTERYAFIARYKVEHGCADCGYNTHPAALDFDHLPGYTKVRNITRMLDRTTDADFYAEIAKCEVVCANCHRIRTMSRRVASSE